jgi:glutathione S-transferase
MKLYSLPGACSLASHIVLEWIGKPYEAQLVSRTEIKEPAFIALNAIGSVPVLTDGDLTLTQSAAILEYLAELNPQAGLLGETTREKAETRRWLALCNSDLHRTFNLIFAAATYVTDPQAQADLTASAAKRVMMLFGVANQQLANKDYLTGSRSIADPYLYTIMRWAKAKNVDLSHLANLQPFFARMDADAGVQAALKAEGLV